MEIECEYTWIHFNTLEYKWIQVNTSEYNIFKFSNKQQQKIIEFIEFVNTNGNRREYTKIHLNTLEYTWIHMNTIF